MKEAWTLEVILAINVKAKARLRLKQGYNLSPLLANIFFSDVHQALEKEYVCAPQLNKHRVTLISWADDFLIISLSASGLQKYTYRKLGTVCKKVGFGFIYGKDMMWDFL